MHLCNWEIDTVKYVREKKYGKAMAKMKTDRISTIFSWSWTSPDIQLLFDSNLSSNWKGLLGYCQWMISWAWMSECRYSHQWLLMGQSVNLNVLWIWGIISYFCQHGQERAVGHPDIMQFLNHLSLALSSMVVYNSLQNKSVLPFDLANEALNIWRVFFPLQWSWCSWESIQEEPTTPSY